MSKKKEIMGRCDAVQEKPIDYDWSEGYPEKWEYWEASECPECGKILVGAGEVECDKAGCDGTVYNEGPMMNYYYPLPGLEDPTEAAKKISDVCLCIVQIDGEYGLALTGGGMDLSWEICAAFIQLGYFPPVHFAGNLPKMAGKEWNKDTRTIIEWCKESVKIASSWVLRDLERVTEIETWLKENKKKNDNKKTAKVGPTG